MHSLCLKKYIKNILKIVKLPILLVRVISMMGIFNQHLLILKPVSSSIPPSIKIYISSWLSVTKHKINTDKLLLSLTKD
jgi:hypothetical protein